jgi:hypothetical protein
MNEKNARITDPDKSPTHRRCDKMVDDVARLLAVKRRPKKQKQKCLTSFFIRKYENL